MVRQFASLFVFILLAFTSGCAGDKINQEKQTLPHTHWFDGKIGEKPIRIQLAVSEKEMRKGLMERTELGKNDGMIFIYPKPQRMSFWMKNTLIPLDIGYLDSDGVLRETYKMYPHDETSVSSQSDRIQFALEMNQGWFS